MERRAPEDVRNAEGLAGWQVTDDGYLRAGFDTGTFARGIELAVAIGAEAETRNHHPDLTITYPRVEIAMTTHDAGGLTDRDVDLARAVTAVAAEMGVELDAEER